MKLNDFKKELKKRNVSYKVFMARALEHRGLAVSDTEAYLASCNSFEAVIEDTFSWVDTPEGEDFWEDICGGGRCISPYGSIFHNRAISTTPCGNKTDWCIGDSILKDASKLKLFKLLAEDLGYEIEGLI